jgi:hypothetical protein
VTPFAATNYALAALLACAAVSHAGVSTEDTGHTAEEWRALICGPDAGAVWEIPPLDRAPSGTLHPPGLAAHGWIVPEALDRSRTVPPTGAGSEPDVRPPSNVPPVSLPWAGLILAGAIGALALTRKGWK